MISAVSEGELPQPGTPAAVRAQLLATEHWSLLATRSMTWSEVMSRIGIHLTVMSASLVVLALVAQASGFDTSAVLILGTLTGIRVHNASVDDAALLVGMNRLRAAYREIDPAIGHYLVASWNDDQAGVLRTYTMGNPRRMVSHVIGSTTMFMNVVNAITAGTLGALVSNASGAGTVGVTCAGIGAGLGYLGVLVEVGRRTFSQLRIEPRFPTREPA
jgi:hypothetical protein